MAKVQMRMVEGYYECPVQFTVDISALKAEYSAVVAGEVLVLKLPSADDVSQFRDELSAPLWHYSERDDLLSSRPEMAPFWGRVVRWTANFDLPKAANVRRFGISLAVDGDDDSVRDIGRRIAEAMAQWWAAVSAWIEVLHGQDLSRLGPIEPGIKFSGCTLWSRLRSLQGHPIRDGAILPVGSSGIGLVWPNYTSVDAQTAAALHRLRPAPRTSSRGMAAHSRRELIVRRTGLPAGSSRRRSGRRTRRH